MIAWGADQTGPGGRMGGWSSTLFGSETQGWTWTHCTAPLPIKSQKVPFGELAVKRRQRDTGPSPLLHPRRMRSCGGASAETTPLEPSCYTECVVGLSPGGRSCRCIVKAASFDSWGVFMMLIVDLGSVWPSRKHRPWWTLKCCPTTPCGVHAEAGPLGKVSPSERAQ